MKNILLMCVITLVFVSCANTSGSSPTIGYSGFDQAKTVRINPHGNICGMFEPCTGLGASWSQEEPGHALLLVKIWKIYSGIIGAELNIDGDVLALQPTKSITAFSPISTNAALKESTKSFVISMRDIQRVVDAKRVWLRVNTPAGTIEHAVIDGDKDSKSYHALKRFMLGVRG